MIHLQPMVYNLINQGHEQTEKTMKAGFLTVGEKNFKCGKGEN